MESERPQRLPKTAIRDISLVAWSRAWIGEVDPLEVVAESPPEIAAVGPREVHACVGDGGLAKSS